MKKLFCMIALAGLALTAMAQKPLNISTYNGTSVERYDGQLCNVTADRYLFTGWNTISMPFAMTEQEIDDALGMGVKLEKLVGVTQQGTEIVLNFQDCKAEGIEANKPYILYYPGEAGTKKFHANTQVASKDSKVTFTTDCGVELTMNGAAFKTDGKGLYGILAINNSDANFTSIDNDKAFFYATRCYISIPGDQQFTLTPNHLGAGEVTSINEIAAANDIIDVYNVLGMRVAHNVKASDVNSLAPGIYVVKGRKILVK
ncbi:MAG: hypothetical protein IKW83_03205 [Muribaculaceae bacterium]|nr:hypothetical protein [Muribaculaceae bacterium]